MKIAIAGAGKLGIKVTEMLLSGDHAVTVIDKDDDVLQRLASNYDIMAVSGNAKETALLKSIDIHAYDYLLSCTDRDEKNIVIASFAKKLGCRHVIARLRDMEHMAQQEFVKEVMDIDHVINPDYVITQEIYKYLVEKYTISNGIFATGKINLLEFPASKLPELAGLAIAGIKAVLGDILVVAISRNGKIIIPRGDIVMQEEDTLYVAGKKELIHPLRKRVHEVGRFTDLRKVMIAGGGKTGQYLAKLLSEYGAAVKLIERDKARCQYLSSHLENVLVLHGDATDLELLEEEDFKAMDAFVSATGYDEENLLLALMAKQNAIEDVIAKISRDSYKGLVESMGIDMVLNPVNISANHILRLIQGSNLIVFSRLIQGQAEFFEFIADENMLLADKPISQLNLPRDSIIAAIHRGSGVIIPSGGTEIREGDRVVALCLLSAVGELEKLFRIRKGLFG